MLGESIAHISGKSCRFHHFTGTVLSSLKQRQTVVTSAADLGQDGADIVTASTIAHHELFLLDKNRAERSF